jgi:hypothetical protein
MAWRCTVKLQRRHEAIVALQGASASAQSIITPSDDGVVDGESWVVWVGGLHRRTTSKELIRALLQFGEVCGCVLRATRPKLWRQAAAAAGGDGDGIDDAADGMAWALVAFVTEEAARAALAYPGPIEVGGWGVTPTVHRARLQEHLRWDSVDGERARSICRPGAPALSVHSGHSGCSDGVAGTGAGQLRDAWLALCTLSLHGLPQPAAVDLREQVERLVGATADGAQVLEFAAGGGGGGASTALVTLGSFKAVRRMYSAAVSAGAHAGPSRRGRPGLWVEGVVRRPLRPFWRPF